MWKKVDGRTKDVILFLYKQKGYIPKSVVAQTIGTHRVYVHRIYNKLEKQKIISNDRLNRNKIKIKKYSVEALKDYIGGCLFGVIVTSFISIFMGLLGVFLFVGALIVFFTQSIITLYKLSKIKENMEVYIKV